MEHAYWQADYAEGRKKTELDVADVEGVQNPGRTPAITKKLLEMDDAQLDLLTAQRSAIFKLEKQSPTKLKQIEADTRDEQARKIEQPSGGAVLSLQGAEAAL